jgi:hypothetical protein
MTTASQMVLFGENPAPAPAVHAPAVIPTNKVDWKELYGALSKLPKSKYAIPTSELMGDFMVQPVDNDYVFVETREFKKTAYLRRLVGSYGGFTRIKPAPEDTLMFVRVLLEDPYKYAKLFAVHYSCCAKCGAELTDEVSRELGLGPICRKAFGK